MPIGYFLNFTTKATLVASLNEGIDFSNYNQKWFSLENEEYHGFYSKGYLDNFYVSYNDFDFSKYTYIVTIGHKLEKISFSFSDMKNRGYTILPHQFVGKVVLDRKYTKKIFIYRIRKMDINCDYHMPDRKITYVNN